LHADYSYADCVYTGPLVASVGIDAADRPVFLFQAVIVVPAARNPSAGIGHLIGRIHRLTCRTAFMDTSRGAHVVVRLDLVGRLNNERR
jgi:hypothetical protein